jgi:arginyl-tRNA synthetase
VQLVDWISRLPQEIQRAAQEYKPLLLATLGYELARSFNDFYQACPVLKADPEVKSFRIRLVAAAKQTLSNILSILGIPAPEIM